MVYLIEETRERILVEAERMFIEKGLSETTMKNLAESIGISRTSLYRYYRDKLDLSLAILIKLLTEIHDFQKKEMKKVSLSNGLSRFEYWIRLQWLSPQFIESQRFLGEFDAYYSGARIPEGFREKMEKALEFITDEEAIAFLQEGIDDGSIQPDINVHLTAETMLNALRSLNQRLLLRGKILVEVLPEDLGLIMDELIRILINGIKNHN